jgi:hypothetical protein
MRTSCAVLLLASADLAIGQGNRSVESLAACYQLQVPAWKPARVRANRLLPMRFELTSRPKPPIPGRPNQDAWFIARNVDSNAQFMLSQWKLNQDGTLDSSWSTSFEGYEVHLTRSGVGFRGMARHWTDTDPLPPHGPSGRTETVAVERIECKDSRTRSKFLVCRRSLGRINNQVRNRHLLRFHSQAKLLAQCYVDGRTGVFIPIQPEII